MPLVFKNARIQGILVGSREIFEEMIRAMTVNNVHPVVDRGFSVRADTRGVSLSRERRPFGKVLRLGVDPLVCG
jgi:hypothetical protein